MIFFAVFMRQLEPTCKIGAFRQLPFPEGVV